MFIGQIFTWLYIFTNYKHFIQTLFKKAQYLTKPRLKALLQ